MEEKPDPSIKDTDPVNVPQQTTQKSSGWKIAFFVLLVLIAGLVVGAYYYTSGKFTINETTPGQQSANSQNTGTPTLSGNWSTTPKNFMGNYTFQYPAGWHIANQWPANYSDAITIFVDPNPLNFAPRGGPISALRITDLAGKPNPDELFVSERDKFKAILTDEKEEVINSDFGPIYHYWGKIDVYNQMEDMEGYYFQIQGGINDLINKHNIFATTDTNTKYSDILRKVVLSFKRSE